MITIHLPRSDASDSLPASRYRFGQLAASPAFSAENNGNATSCPTTTTSHAQDQSTSSPSLIRHRRRWQTKGEGLNIVSLSPPTVMAVRIPDSRATQTFTCEKANGAPTPPDADKAGAGSEGWSTANTHFRPFSSPFSPLLPPEPPALIHYLQHHHPTLPLSSPTMGSPIPSTSPGFGIAAPPHPPSTTPKRQQNKPLPPRLRTRKKTFRHLPSPTPTPAPAPPSSTPSDEDDEPTAPFVHRTHRHSLSRGGAGNRETPQEIQDSVVYAQICGAYLGGWAGSIDSFFFAEEDEESEVSPPSAGQRAAASTRR